LSVRIEHLLRRGQADGSRRTSYSLSALLLSYIETTTLAHAGKDVKGNLAGRLVTVTACCALTMPIGRLPKFRLVDDKTTRGREARGLIARAENIAQIQAAKSSTGEAVKQEWRHVPLEPAPAAKYGYIHIPGGKSKNARRNVPIADRLAEMLLNRSLESKSVYVFPSETGRFYRVSSIDHMHNTVREGLQMSLEFVIYSQRHTYSARLGEALAAPFAIMRLM